MSKSSSILDFKGISLHTLRLVLHTAETADLLQALEARLKQAGEFYAQEAVVLDATNLEQAPDWAALIATLRQYHLHPIGVQAREEFLAAAMRVGLAPLQASPARASEAPAKESRQSRRVESATVPTQPTQVIRHPLRSGQRIYARDSDLIILGMVSQGAEVIADGHIHVYGPLRGKAMAGAKGNRQAMILTTQLDPELLAIAGIYRVIETELPDTLLNRPARIELDGETLRMHALPLHN